MKKIGVIGSGIVGKTLAPGFHTKGYEVIIGTRNPDKLESWNQELEISIKSPEQTAKESELIVLCVKGTAALDVLKNIDVAYLKGKTVIDTTNPIADAPPVNGVLQYFTPANDSLMETLQRAYPEVHFVKAFNSVGSDFMVDPDFGSLKPSMFICGNNESSKIKVREILQLFGWEVEDMGAVEAARAIEALCMLWCIPGFLENKWQHAFKLLKV